MVESRRLVRTGTRLAGVVDVDWEEGDSTLV